MTNSEYAGTDLRALKNRPFDLLRELERRSKAALAGARGDNVDVEEWVGIGFRLDDEQFIVSREEVREVMMVPNLIARVPGARPWVRGLANVRGHLMPMVDLKTFFGAGRVAAQRDARVLVIQGSELTAGLVVDEVFGFRRFLASERSDAVPEMMLPCAPFVPFTFERGVESWPVFSIERLEGSEEFQRAAA